MCISFNLVQIRCPHFWLYPRSPFISGCTDSEILEMPVQQGPVPVSIPGPAGILQAAIDRGAIPERLSALPQNMLGQSATCLNQADAVFSSASWLQACASERVDPSFDPPPTHILTARALRLESALRCRRMVLVMHDIRSSVSGDAFVLLKVLPPTPVWDCHKEHCKQVLSHGSRLK
jgi:hypothetical protein